jgi:mRNA-degrading endonuclease RelE of RelBE toxin-antitoxin system
MSYSIILTHRFEKEIKRLVKKFSTLKSEFTELISDIINNPKTGTYIGNNCYKIRLNIGSKRKGKRGGARGITYLYFKTETIYLLTIYDKSEKHELTPNELLYMIQDLVLE